MDLMDKKLEDLVVTLPFADGNSIDCGVYSVFEVDGAQYISLLPLNEDRSLDASQGYMIYKVGEDSEKNPVVLYIEDDDEYNKAAKVFSDSLGRIH